MKNKRQSSYDAESGSAVHSKTFPLHRCQHHALDGHVHLERETDHPEPSLLGVTNLRSHPG
jgi:hypothetical protein